MPFRMLRMVPLQKVDMISDEEEFDGVCADQCRKVGGEGTYFGLRHISLRPNSLTRASSAVMVAHLMPTLYCWMALAASMVIWSLVASRLVMERS